MRIRVRKKYNIILADPPWTFKVWSEKGLDRSAIQHYDVMRAADIKALPVNKLAAEDCVLFLWVTSPLLELGIEVVKKWGFKYKTVGFAWAKETKNGHWHMGNGYWTRANIELCILATRGHPRRISAAVRQLVHAKIGTHSAKPPEVRDRIVELLGDLPRVELFARERCPGWDSIGLEIDGKDIREVLK